MSMGKFKFYFYYYIYSIYIRARLERIERARKWNERHNRELKIVTAWEMKRDK